MSTFDPNALAAEIKAAQDDVQTLATPTSRYRDFSVLDGYRVARLIHQARLVEGFTPVGRKIGFTNSAMWAQLGVEQPVWAYMYDRTVAYSSGAQARCDLRSLYAPRIEPEIVVHFSAAPPVTDDPAEILKSIDWIAHGIEIVQSHYPDWKFKAADTVADRGLHGKLIVGPKVAVQTLGPAVLQHLKDFSVRLSCNTDLIETGRGSNVLGSPLAAVAHLLSVLTIQPDDASVQAGELITTGTITKAYPVQSGETWSTEISGLALPGLNVSFD